MIKFCEICGKEFKTSPSLVKKGHGRFCSLRCKGKAEHSKRKLLEHEGKTVYIGRHGYALIVLGWSQEKLFHVYLMERHLGVPLKGKIVHHIDGNKLNNSIENLKVLDNDKEHRMEHAKINIERLGGVWGVNKFCPKCLQLKLLSDFHNTRRTYDGKYGWCKSCACKNVKKYQGK